MRISLITDKKLLEPSDNISSNLINLNNSLSKLTTVIPNLSLQQYLYHILFRYIPLFNYSLYETNIKDYILNTYENGAKIFNNSNIIPVIEYVELNRNLSMLYSVFKTRQDSLVKYINNEDLFLLNNISAFNNNNDLKFISECVEVNQILNFQDTSRPILNNSPYTLYYLLNSSITIFQHTDYFSIVFNPAIHLTILYIVHTFVTYLKNYFYQNNHAQKVINTFKYYLLNKIYEITAGGLFIEISSSKYIPPYTQTTITTGIEKYLQNIIAPTMNQTLETIIYQFFDKLTKNNSINFTDAIIHLRYQIYKYISNLINDKQYLDLIKINDLSISQIFDDDKELYIGILGYIIEQEDLMFNVLSNISYNVNFIDHLNSSLLYSFDVNGLYQINVSSDSEVIEKIVSLFNSREYLSILSRADNKIHEQLLVNFISAHDIYAFMSDLLTIFYALKYLV
jgi:hypothetical protein